MDLYGNIYMAYIIVMAITLYFDHKSAVSIGVQSYIQGGQQIAFITSRGTTP